MGKGQLGMRGKENVLTLQIEDLVTFNLCVYYHSFSHRSVAWG